MKIKKSFLALAILAIIGSLLVLLSTNFFTVVLAQEIIGEEGTIISIDDLIGEEIGNWNNWDLVGEEGDIIHGSGLIGEEGGVIPGNDLIGEQGGIIPGPGCQETVRDFPQCGGTVGLEGFSPADTIIVREFTNTCDGSKRFDVLENKGNLGQCQQSAAPQNVQQPQAIAPIPQTPIIQSMPQFMTPGGDTTNNNINNNNQSLSLQNRISNEMNNNIDLEQNQNQSQNQWVNANSNAQTGPISINVVGQRPQGSAAQPMVIVPRQTLAVPQVVAMPQVITVSGKQIASDQLPKTGLPFVAWALSGLLPIGFRLRKYGQEKNNEGKANYIWQKRQFFKD